MSDKQIAELIGEPFAVTEKGLKLSKKIQDCNHEMCNIIFEDLKSPLRYKNGNLIIIKESNE